MFKALNVGFKRSSLKELLAYLFLSVFLFFVFIWRLANLTPGLSPSETSARTASLSLRTIYANPVFAPYKIVQHFFLKLDASSILYLRLPAVIFGVIFAACFYRLAVSWFGRAIGIFATLAFISLPLFVISARQGSAEIMFFMPTLLMWLYYKFIKAQGSSNLILIALIVSCALAFYVPGMIWWLAAAIILTRKSIRTAAADTPISVSVIGFTAGLIIVLPMIISAITHPVFLKTLALIPQHMISALRITENIGWMVLALFVRAPDSNPLILGRLPLINVLLLALVVFGGYALYRAARPKAYCLALAVIYAVLAAGLNDNIRYLILGLPALAIFISAGLRYLYIEWRSIFPINPVPKTFALALIAAVVASQLFFGLRYSLEAWPHSTATKSIYVLK